MSDKEKTAIERLQFASEMSMQLYKLPLLIGDSGGKDSAVICRLAENAGIPFEIVHSHTTADAPETVRHVRKRAKEYEEKGFRYTIKYPTYKGQPISMWSLIVAKKIPPTRMARYCCDVLKETAGKGRFMTTGVRWAESSKRKTSRAALEILGSKAENKILLNNDNDEDRRLFETCQMKGKRIVNPIVDWSTDEVWEYIRDQKLELDPGYSCGFSRRGCVGCPLASKKNRQREFAQYPKYMQMYINTFERMVEARREAGEKARPGDFWVDGKAVFNWWMEYDNVLPGQIELFEEGAD